MDLADQDKVAANMDKVDLEEVALETVVHQDKVDFGMDFGMEVILKTAVDWEVVVEVVVDLVEVNWNQDKVEIEMAADMDMDKVDLAEVALDQDKVTLEMVADQDMETEMEGSRHGGFGTKL